MANYKELNKKLNRLAKQYQKEKEEFNKMVKGKQVVKYKPKTVVKNTRKTTTAEKLDWIAQLGGRFSL